MITPEVISRINELAKKQQENRLTDQERHEQMVLRRLYIDNVKKQVKVQLDAAKSQAHSDSCDCGCHTKH
jgi:uncharacterized protein YnzC (UPF0291/DUF896 family)